MSPRIILVGTALCLPLAAPGSARAAPRPAPLPAATLDALWADLAGKDARRAYAALCRLADRPAEAVPFLRTHLRAAAPPDARRIARLIAELDHDDYATRNKASEALAQLGDRAAPALRKALTAGPSLELRRRVEVLLKQLDRPLTDPEELRQVRVVEALERMQTMAARRLLTELAKGAPEARLTREARASLRRLKKGSLPPGAW